jgi:hypothetical protein
LYINENCYKSLDECLVFLDELKDDDFEYPNEKVLFHMYSDVKNEKELLSIQSFFVTQNLDKCELVLWSDFDNRDNPLLNDFKDLIDFRIWNPIVEAKDTILSDFPFLDKKDKLFYLQSDLMRIIVIHKYGGIWIDMDLVLLRDLKPLMGKEFVHQWGNSLDPKVDGASATIYSGLKGSEFTAKVLEMIKKHFIIPFSQTLCWGQNVFKLLSKEYEYNILPCAFFDIDWFTHPETPRHLNLMYKVLNFKYDGELYLNCFTWHWHNSFNIGIEMVDNSKFDRVRKYMLSKL